MGGISYTYITRREHDMAHITSHITSHRIGPGHYEVRLHGEAIGWLFDDVQSRQRPASDPERWRFSPASLNG